MNCGSYYKWEYDLSLLAVDQLLIALSKVETTNYDDMINIEKGRQERNWSRKSDIAEHRYDAENFKCLVQVLFPSVRLSLIV